MKIGELQSIIVTAVVLPVVVYLVRYWWERRRWRIFAQQIGKFARDEAFVELLTRDSLRALVAAELSDAGFEPKRIEELLEVAFQFALGRISQVTGGRIFGDLAESGQEDSDG